MIVRNVMIAGGGLAIVLAAGLGLAAFAAPGPAAPPADQDDSVKPCFRVRDVEGVSVSSPIGEKKLDGVNIRVRRDTYQIALRTICSELQGSVRIGIESRSGTQTICHASDLVVVARDATTGQRRQCSALSVHRLTPAELSAMPKNERP